jgi:shikimate dehydrogenase
MAAFFRLAVLGDPIDHSRSPAIQQAALATAGIPGEYSAIRADRARLEAAVDQLRAGTLDGINVTMPLKGDAWELAEGTTEEASRARSINAMRYRDGVIEGHSADVMAFRGVLTSGPFGHADPLLVLGAGGSARAALAAVNDREVYLSARSGERAAQLAKQFGAVIVPWATPIVGALVVNATPLGMHGESLPRGLVGASAGLIDLPYGAETTPAASEAAASSVPVVDGFEFLARQAARSFHWWTGVAVDFVPLAIVARNA